MSEKKITSEEVFHIAELAHLYLDVEKAERLARDLSEILSYVAKLNELDTAAVEPMMHAVPMQNVFREDIVCKMLPRDEALRGAPVHDGEYFLVPKILEVD